MSILNRPSDGLPSVLLALRRALIAYGPQESERLIQLCAPGTLNDSGMARKTLTRWRQLGFFESDEAGVVKLAPSVKKIPVEDLNGLRAALLQLVLTPENNPALAQREEEEDEKAEKSKAADFSTAASWALAQDPYGFPHAFPAVEKMISAQNVARKLFSNSTRWNGFQEWAVFLGLGIQTGKVALVPNPFFAVASVLDKVFQGAKELPQNIFLARLAEFLPIIDGGSYRQIVDAETTQPWYKCESHQLSPCLSAALQTLMEKRLLHLEPRSDAQQRTLLGRQGRETRYAFSHVVYLEAA